MEELLAQLNSYRELPAELQVALLKTLVKKQYPKNKTILHAGEIAESIFYIEEGVIKTCFDSGGGNETALWYNRESDIAGSMQSYFTGLPSKVSICAVTDVVLRIISKKELDYLYEKFPAFNYNARRVVEKYYGISEQHILLMKLPPRERFQKLLEWFPWMNSDKRITDKMLAAFMGITPETLSNYRHGR